MMRIGTSLLITQLLLTLLPQQPLPVLPERVVIRCDGGSIDINADVIHLTCNGGDARIATSAVRNITLATDPRFVIPLAPYAGVPVGKTRSLHLRVAGRDGREHFVLLSPHQEDLIAGVSALTRLTGLSVFTDRLDEELSKAGIPQRVDRYRFAPVSPERQEELADSVPRSADMTAAGDVVIVYDSGRVALWTPASMNVRRLDNEASGRSCRPVPRIVGLFESAAAVFACGQVLVYDLDRGGLSTSVAVDDPASATLNSADNALYWLASDQLHRRELVADAVESAPIDVSPSCNRLAFSPRGDLMFCSRVADASGRRFADLHVYRFEAGRPGAAVRLRSIGTQDASTVGIHPQRQRIVTLTQSRSLKVKDVLTFWDLQPTLTRAREIELPKGVNPSYHPRYSADGSLLVVSGHRTLAIDAGTGTIRCELPESLATTSRPNAMGLTVGIAYTGKEIGQPPRVIVWDAATCAIRRVLDGELEFPTTSEKTPR